MNNKIIDINEWLRWVISLHPSQKQITTIKSYWKCNTKDDYLKVFKKDIEHRDSFISDDIKDDEWIDGKYSWDLDRLFDIYKFVPDCEQLAKVNIGYFPLNETLLDDKWKDYIQVIKEYDKEVKDTKNGPYTFRVVKVDFGIFKIYARQTRSLEGNHRYIMLSNSKNEEYEKQNNLTVSWSDDQCIFISIPVLKINKDLIKNNHKVELQSEKRLYCFNDNSDNKYQLPELYYPNNIRTFIDYCIDKKILPFSKSIRIWAKVDNHEIKSDYMTEEELLKYHPFPMMNIKSKKDLKDYIKDRKRKHAYEISKDLPKTLTINYNINDIFIPINLINQDIVNKFIDEMNNSKLYEIIK